MANRNSTIDHLCQIIRGQFRGGRYNPFIDFIEFPKYKNFQKGTRVTFGFPLTAVVGQNGTGKSSLLHAMYGAPYGLQPGRWWFGTALDPIDDGLDGTEKKRRLQPGDKASFWYQYTFDKETYQAVKMRVRREGDPDYWEPSRAIKSFGMELVPKKGLESDRDRDPQVDMDAIYMNFKTQISAFDRCFYFNPPEAISRVDQSAHWRDVKKDAKRRKARIQDYLRWRSRRLRAALIDGKLVKHGGREFHNARVELTQPELHDISEIIGREYNSGYLLEHRFYETWGVTVMFNTEDRSYSDAFAGSGESAVVRLVHEVANSKPGRLILLDEPETSLHPGAQERLLAFLLREVEAKKLQVVLSTHSPAIVRPLPKEAIRVMSLNAENRVFAQEDVGPDEAFFVLGHPLEDRIQLIVEDRLGKDLVDAILMKADPHLRSKFSCVYRPGGDSAMKRDAFVYMQDKDVRRVFIFDGDKRSEVTDFDISRVPINATSEEFDAAIKEWLKCSLAFNQDSKMSEEKKVEIRKAFISFATRSFRCFPFDTPEEVIWSDERARQQLAVLGEEAKLGLILEEMDYKERYRKLCELMQPEGHDLRGVNIQTLHGIFLTGFVKEQGAAFSETLELLKEIANVA
ncbi:AAA family ATPase [Rosistilla oblonga]|uniref:AAA family ATPase n=1 Tax=Rosistilla oblonga TaxID=2527990 RepID=UPI003A971D79